MEVRTCLAEACSRPAKCKGLCQTHYHRLWRHGSTADGKWSHIDPDARFWASVDKSGKCWNWTGPLDHEGYGRLQSHGGSRVRAHRYSYQMHKGPISEECGVLHSCDNRACVNPEHLRAGTHIENMLDMVGRGRSTRGAKNPRAKLTEAKVQEIRRRFAEGGITQRNLGAEYGVCDMTVSLIVRHKLWN